MTGYEIMKQCTKLGLEDHTISYATISAAKFLIRTLDMTGIDFTFQSAVSHPGTDTIFIMASVLHEGSVRQRCYEVSSHGSVPILEGGLT